jgi:cell division protein FtsW (lipid II flippase)
MTRDRICGATQTVNQLRSNAALIATLLFQLSFVGLSLLQSGTGHYKVTESVDGIAYYHTQTVPIASFLGKTFLVLLLAEVLIYLLLDKLLDTSPEPVICPVFILLTISLTYQSYINSSSSAAKHFIFVCMGLLVFLGSVVLAKVVARTYLSVRLLLGILIGISVLCVLNLILGLTHPVNGSGAFIKLLGVKFQPGEFLKVVLILFVGVSFVQLKEYAALRWCFVAVIGVALLTLLLIKDIGNALILAAVALTVIYMIYGGLVTSGVVAGGGVLALIGYRILCLVNPTSYIITRVSNTWVALTTSGANANLRRALLSVVRAGLFGKGLNNSLYATNNYAANTDFCFDTILSIWGIGLGILIVGCYVVLLRANRIQLRETGQDMTSFTFSNIMAVLIGTQAVVHIGGNLNLLPLTGVCLPLISVGGSNLICSMLCIGFALGGRLSDEVALQVEKKLATVSDWADHQKAFRSAGKREELQRFKRKVIR